jgi:hypothetical protein
MNQLAAYVPRSRLPRSAETPVTGPILKVGDEIATPLPDLLELSCMWPRRRDGQKVLDVEARDPFASVVHEAEEGTQVELTRRGKLIATFEGLFMEDWRD